MKISTSLLCSLSPIFVASAESDVGTQHIRRRLGLQSQPCILIEQEVQYIGSGDNDGRIFHCELQGADVDFAEATFVTLEGLDENELEDHGVISGVTTLKVEDAEIVPKTGKLKIPSNSKREYGMARGKKEGRNGGTNDDNTAKGRGAKDSILIVRGRELVPLSEAKKVVVVRIMGNDFSTTADISALSDAVFGTSGDSVNLRERYDSCSYGQLTMEPFEGTTDTGVSIAGGVVEVEISNNIQGADDFDIKNAAVAAAAALLGDLESQFDHVMLCIPPGTSGGWIAWAYVNHWLSVYNDEWCTYPSAQMHELGHNLNLAHAGEGTSTYGDQTGMMGYSYSQDEGPIMCFNNAKSWQLGWYSDKRKTVNVLNDGSFSGDLVGVDDYLSAGDNEYVNIKVENGSNDLFIGFNRKTGINSGTIEAPNLVTIQSQGSAYSASLLLAELDQGFTYEVSNYLSSEEKLLIKVVSIGTKASIQIYLEGGGCTVDNDCILDGASCAVGSCQGDGTCSFDKSFCQGLFEFTLLTDYYPSETSWEVKDECDDGNVVYSGGSYSETATTYVARKELGFTRYTLTVSDSYGDGICCLSGYGNYLATLDGVELASGGDFGSEISTTFGSCATPPAQWVQIFFEGFDDGFGAFSDGGKEVSINGKKKYEGSASLLIKDDKSSSIAWTNDYDVSQYSKLKVNFFYRSSGVDNNEGFALEYSVNGGSSWVEADSFLKGDDWQDDNTWEGVSVEFVASAIDSVRLQFRGQTSNKNDQIYIDSVLFEGMA